MKLKSVLISSCLGLLAVFCSISSKAEAVFASTKSLGMAATAISYPLDTLAGAYNPAGLVWVGNRIDTGIGWLHDNGSSELKNNNFPFPLPGLTANGKYNGMRTKDVYPAEIGFNKVFCGNCFDWSVGLIIYNRNYQKTTYSRSVVLFGESHVGLEFLDQTVAPILAARWGCHSIGVSFDYQIERLKVQGLENFDNPLFTIDPGHVTNRGYSWATGFSATFGYRGVITDHIAIGATYAPKAKMSKFKKYTGFVVDGRIDVPEKIGAGISFYWNCLTLCFDWELVRWSGVRSLHNKLAEDLIADKLGSKNGTGFGFRDVNYYRVGLEWWPCETLSLRTGFRHSDAFFSSSQNAVNTLALDCVIDFWTVGATWYVNPCNELSFFYGYGFERKIRGKDVIPALLGGGDVTLRERKNGLSVAWGWKY